MDNMYIDPLIIIIKAITMQLKKTPEFLFSPNEHTLLAIIFYTLVHS
jgi:hypothetical protein